MSIANDDQAAILELSARFCHKANCGEFDGLLELFTEDACFEAPLKSWSVHRDTLPNIYIGIVGHEQVKQHSATPGGQRNRLPVVDAKVSVLHYATAHSIVQGSRDSATMVCYFTYYWVDDPPRIMAYGRYLDRLTKVEGKWKFAHRIVDTEWDGRVESSALGAVEHAAGATSSDAVTSTCHPWAVRTQVTSLTAEDRQAILELSARYCHALDYGDWDSLLQLYTEDLRLESRLRSWSFHVDRIPNMYLRLVGHAQLRQFFTNPANRPDLDSARRGRLTAATKGNVSLLDVPTVRSIQSNGESATMTSDFTYYLDDPSRTPAHGRYVDRLTRVEGKWRFAHRRVDLESYT